jgi:hypothetical protein
MTKPEKKGLRKPYHPPEVKDYGNISQITAGAGKGMGEGAGGSRT